MRCSTESTLRKGETGKHLVHNIAASQVIVDVGLGPLFEGLYIILTPVSLIEPDARETCHLVRKPVNRFGRWVWWLRRIPIPRSCPRRELEACVRTKGCKNHLSGVQVINHSLKAVAGRSGMNIHRRRVLHTLQPPCHV